MKEEQIDEIKLLQQQADNDFERLEHEASLREDSDYSGIPSQGERENFFKLLDKIIATTDSSKVGNLNKQEIGMLKHSVRKYQSVALLSDALDRPLVSEYLRQKGEIILATSLSKKAKLLMLMVSKIRTSENIKQGDNESSSGNGKWWKKFSKGDIPDET